MSLLYAVNVLLESIGEDRVNSLDNPSSDVNIARSVIQQQSRGVQTNGWWFNREFNLPLHANNQGELPLPANLLSSEFKPIYRFVQRGQYVYDRINRTKVITDAVTANVILELPFNDLPASAMHYIIIRSARIFQDRVLGSSSLHGFQRSDEVEALVSLKEDETLNTGYSHFAGGEMQQLFDRTPSYGRSLTGIQRRADV